MEDKFCPVEERTEANTLAIQRPKNEQSGKHTSVPGAKSVGSNLWLGTVMTRHVHARYFFHTFPPETGGTEILKRGTVHGRWSQRPLTHCL